MGILVKTAASIEDVKGLVEPINENINNISSAIGNMQEQKADSIQVLAGEEYKATGGKIDISPSVEPIKSATENNANAIKDLGDKVNRMDGSSILIEVGSGMTVKEYLDQELGSIREELSKTQEQINYIVCTDIRTEDSVVISLESNVPLTELKDGMVVSFSPKYNSQEGAKIKINDLEEVDLNINLGYLSFLKGNSYELVYVEVSKLFKSNKLEPLIGLTGGVDVSDMNELLYDADFYLFSTDKVENFAIEEGNSFVRVRRFLGIYVIQEVQIWSSSSTDGAMYRRTAYNTDNQWEWSSWYEYTGSIDTLLRDNPLVTKQSAVKMGKSNK